ncbi:unnamed protein product, partial [Staurois parvus]
MGPCTASSCCCQAPNLPWAPVPPPHAAARSTVCHGSHRLPLCVTLPCATFRSPHTAAGFHFVIRGLPCWQITGLHCCWARPLICHGPLYCLPVPPPHAAARSTVCHGSLYRLPAALSPSPHSAMCHFQVSSHC